MNKHKKSGSKTYYQYALPDFYKLYKDRPLKNTADRDTYKNFLFDFFALIFKEIVHNKWSFYIPNRLGFLKLTSSKNNLRPPADKSRLEKGKKPVLLNQHSHNRAYKFTWVKKFVRFPNSKYYKFKPWASQHAFEAYGVGTKSIWKMIMDTTKDPDKKLIR